MAALLDGDDLSVLDLGCGDSWLLEYLPDGVRYYGCDYVSRAHTDFICDFCAKQFPPPSFRVDAMFASGVLEYVKDPSWFISQMCSGAKRKVLVSYVTLAGLPDRSRRRRLGWKNHLTRDGLVKTFDSHDFSLVSLDEGICGNNDVFIFKRNYLAG
ncbi:MAG TPA: methyltransferase domain-containing protein [Actinomycetota bacterium]|nr:methyltransferase domain-containing protein [Actinomycetota bacterium]